MIIALFPNELKDPSLTISQSITQFLKEREVTVVTEERMTSALDVSSLNEVGLDQINFCLSLGGDGTILRLLHRYPMLRAPLLAINLGGLGFLADIPLSDIYPSLEDLLEGHFTIQHRMMIEGYTAQGETCFAVNEVVVHRTQPHLIDLALHVDGLYLNTFSADGIILSTPSGSTAYSLSAGGPIVAPDLEAFIITPICPHTISNRPIVLMPRKEVRVQYLSPHQPAEVSYDGIHHTTLETLATLTVFPSLRRFSFVKLARHDYFSTLREKLGWQGKLKNSL